MFLWTCHAIFKLFTHTVLSPHSMELMSRLLNCLELIPESVPKKSSSECCHQKFIYIRWAHREYDKLQMIIPKVAFVYASAWRYRKNQRRERKEWRFFFLWSVRNHLRWRRTFFLLSSAYSACVREETPEGSLNVCCITLPHRTY
jgi:hypothetical protein